MSWFPLFLTRLKELLTVVRHHKEDMTNSLAARGRIGDANKFRSASLVFFAH